MKKETLKKLINEKSIKIASAVLAFFIFTRLPVLFPFINNLLESFEKFHEETGYFFIIEIFIIISFTCAYVLFYWPISKLLLKLAKIKEKKEETNITKMLIQKTAAMIGCVGLFGIYSSIAFIFYGSVYDIPVSIIGTISGLFLVLIFLANIYEFGTGSIKILTGFIIFINWINIIDYLENSEIEMPYESLQDPTNIDFYITILLFLSPFLISYILFELISRILIKLSHAEPDKKTVTFIEEKPQEA